MRDATGRRVNVITMKNALDNLPHLLELAKNAQASIRGLGLDEHLAKGFRGVMQLMPVRTVATVSYPLAFASFGAGMLTGAAAAMLLSPKRGDELRASIRQGFERAVARAKPGARGDVHETEPNEVLERGDTSLRATEAVRQQGKEREIARPFVGAKIAD
jgi:hypothetical protein